MSERWDEKLGVVPPTELEHRSTADLLARYGRTLAELRRRGILRTNNPPAGDYGEWLVANSK